MATPTVSRINLNQDGVLTIVWDAIITSAPATASAGGTIPTSGIPDRNGQAYVSLDAVAGLAMSGTGATGSTSLLGLFTSFGSDKDDANSYPGFIGQSFYCPIVFTQADVSANSNVCKLAIPGILGFNFSDPNFVTIHNTVPLTSSYTGPRTQALVSNNIPKIFAVTSNSIRYVCRELRTIGDVAGVNFGRQVKRQGSVGTATLSINGGTPIPCSAALSTYNDSIDLTFSGANITAGAALVLTLPTSYFKFKHPLFSNEWDSIAETVSVQNNLGVPNPSIQQITTSGDGTQLIFDFDQNIGTNGTGPALSVSLSGGIAARTLSAPVFSNDTLSVTVNPPIFSGEVITVSSPAGQVRYAGSTGSDGLSNAYNNILVVNNSTVNRPKPLLTSVSISTNGKNLSLKFNQNIISNSSASLIVNGTYPDTNTTFTYLSTSGDTVTYTTAGQIYIGDICTVNVPAGTVREPVTNNTNDAVNNVAISNTSNISHPAPVLQSIEVEASGTSLLLTYDIAVTAGPNINSFVVTARDESSTTTREIPTSTPSFPSATSVRFVLDGVVFKTDTPAGDDLVTGTCLAGLVDSQQAIAAGSNSYSAVLSAVNITNNSDVDEPATPITPTFAYAQVITEGNKLKIRWTDASANPIDVRYVSGTVTLSGTVTGTITATFSGYETDIGENDTTVFVITPIAVGTDVLTLNIPAGIIQSRGTNTNNAASGPYVSAAASTFENNSQQITPTTPDLPPIVQDIIVGLNGTKLGIYYDVPVTPIIGQAIVDASLSGRKVGSITGAEGVLGVVATLDNTVFTGETLQVTLPYGLVVNTSSNQSSLQLNGFEASNRSIIPVPRNPGLDTATVASTGEVLELVFDNPVSISTGFLYLMGSKSGKHLLEASTQINATTIQFNIAGIIYENEVVTLNMAKDVVRDTAYNFSPNLETLEFTVINNSTETLPALSSGLVQEQ